jgi:CubicO group peptidase (beta-lactamase class C family)
MQRRFFLRVLLVWAVVLCSATTQAQTDSESLSALIENARQEWGVPGLAVAVVKDGETILSAGFGIREVGKPDVVDADTLFAIASNSKAFTAAVLAQLQEESKVQWSDKVQNHLPWMQLYDPWVAAELRIDDLLCHRSGLGTFSGDLLWWGTAYSPEEVLRRTRHLPPEGSFRAHYGYSNLMFLAAGEVIRVADQRSWGDAVKARILVPLGMQRTATSVTQLTDLGNAASPHKTTETDNEVVPWVNWDTMAAAGGLISSASDMSKWVRVQLDRGKIDDSRQLFSEASSHRMWTPHMPMVLSEAALKRNPSTHFRAYGLGWVLSDYKGRLTVSHGGGYDGMYSHVLLVPDDRLGIVILTNSMTGISSSLAMTIADRFLGGPSSEWLKEGLERDRSGRKKFAERIAKAITPTISDTKPSRELTHYAGEFSCPLYGDAEIVLEEGKLVLRLKPNPDLVADLEHLQFDTWIVRWRKQFAWFAEGTIQFVPDSTGDFQELRLDVPNDDLWFHELKLKRVSSSPSGK